jgi:hypothetical protein
MTISNPMGQFLMGGEVGVGGGGNGEDVHKRKPAWGVTDVLQISIRTTVCY